MDIHDKKGLITLISLRGIRSFSYGFVNTSLGFYLTSIGYKQTIIGLLITAAALFSALMVILSGVLSDRLGTKRPFLAFSCLLMAVLGFTYSISDSFPFLLLGSLLGGAGSAGGGGPGGGPFSPIQYALLAEKVGDRSRHRIFGINAMTGTILFSFGALSAALPSYLFQYGIPKILTYRNMFLLVGVLGVISAVLTLLVGEEKARMVVKNDRSFKLIKMFTATAIFNGFGMGLIPLSLITLWFKQYFLADEASISIMVWASYIANAFSYLSAASVASRLGTVRMVVLTTVFGVGVFASLPLMPSFSIAAVLYVATGILLSMGMPIRQSYMMGVVDKESRATAGGISGGVGSGLPYAVSPAISGYIMQEISMNLPIYASASLQFIGSIFYWRFFRRIVPPEEKVGHS